MTQSWVRFSLASLTILPLHPVTYPGIRLSVASLNNNNIVALSCDVHRDVLYDACLYSLTAACMTPVFCMTPSRALACSGMLADRMDLRYFLSGGMTLSAVFTALFGLAYIWEIHSLAYFLIIQVRCCCCCCAISAVIDPLSAHIPSATLQGPNMTRTRMLSENVILYEYITICTNMNMLRI